MISVILAGGKGLRLWPESRKCRPKQLCKFVDNKSMLDHTIDRLIMAGSSRLIIVTNDDLLKSTEELINARPDADIIEVLSEPEAKNTASAVGLILSRFINHETDEVLGVFPADHHILDTKSFNESIYRASLAARRGFLATIGITPNRPETGYGYIEKTKWEVGAIENVFEVNTFCEKPDLSTAQSYLDTGVHMWNAGIYVGKADTLIEEFQQYLPDIYEKMLLGYEGYRNSYHSLPDISLDYGIAEKSKRMAVVTADFGWCDLGSWNALADLYQQDDQKNVVTGNDILVLDSTNCVVKQSNKTVVLFGVEDLLVVETDDIVFISERDRSQDVRNLIDVLNQKQRYDLL